MSLRNSFAAKILYRFIEKRVLPVVERHVKSPTHLTLIGFLFACFVPVGFYFHPIVGVFFMLLSGGADIIDGWWAKHSGLATPFGAFLDSSLDRASDGLFLLGFWVMLLDSKRVFWATILLFFGFLFTVMISYIKARAEALGCNCGVGFMERGTRTVFLIGWGLCLVFVSSTLHLWLFGGFIVFCALTLATVLQRMFHVRRALMKHPCI